MVESSSSNSLLHLLRYLAFFILRLILTLVGNSIIHPDEWLQSMQPMSFLLKHPLQSSHSPSPPDITWDWTYSCYNSSIPAHSPLASRPQSTQLHGLESLQLANQAHSIWRIDMPPSRIQCEQGMQMQMPIRGVIAPYLICGLPFQLFSATAPSVNELHPFLILLPRISQFIWTGVLELVLFFVYRTAVRYLDDAGAKPSSSSNQLHMGLFQFLSRYSACEFVVIVLLCRTFSNSQETFFLAILLFLSAVRIRLLPTLATRLKATWSHSIILSWFYVVFGIVTAQAIWIRLTIVLFAWPIGLYLIYLHYRHHTSITVRDDEDNDDERTGCRVFDHRTNSGRFMLGVRSCFAVGMPTLLGIFIGSAFAIIMDSLFYESIWVCSTLVSESNGAQSIGACTSGIQATFSRLLSLTNSHNLWTTMQSLSFHGRLLVTPFTNYLYNSRAENVAHHGLHPLYTHLVVNWVLLFGPASVIFLLRVTYQSITGTIEQDAHRSEQQLQQQEHIELQGSSSSARMKDGLSRRRPAVQTATVPAATTSTSSTNDEKVGFVGDSIRSSEAWKLFHLMLLLSFWSGMIGLSLIPHQEFRFLAPCFVPIMLLRAMHSQDSVANAPTAGTPSKSTISRFKRVLQNLNLLHRIVTIVLLGILHQGGLLRGYMQLNIDSGNSTTAAAYLTLHTYPTPQSLVRLTTSEKYPAAKRNVVDEILDLHHPSHIAATVSQIVRKRSSSEKGGGAAYVSILFTMPGSVDFPVQQMQETLRSLFSVDTSLVSTNDVVNRCRKQVCLAAKCSAIFPHLSLDEAPRPFDAFTHPPRSADVLYVDVSSSLQIHSSDVRCSGISSRLSLVTYQWIIPVH